MTATSFTVTAVTTVTKKRDMPSLWVARIVCRRIPTFLRNSAAGYHQKTGYNGYSGYGTASMRFGSAHLSDWPLGLDEEPRETVVIPLCPGIARDAGPNGHGRHGKGGEKNKRKET